jgi:tRNA-dihydrouridine synthase A
LDAIGADFGYDEINLNCGCPSDRVQSGRFGACLMREPALVGEGVAAMKAAVKIPVTVKCRIGVDEQEPREALFAFVDQVKAAGADAIVVHARKAWLEGLSPKENRDIPPLDYPLVAALKRAHPDLPIAVNGGIHDLNTTCDLLRDVDGVMMGRAAYQSPELLIDVDPMLFGAPAPVADAFAAIEAYVPYVERELARDVRLHDMTRHLLGLVAGRHAEARGSKCCARLSAKSRQPGETTSNRRKDSRPSPFDVDLAAGVVAVLNRSR